MSNEYQIIYISEKTSEFEADRDLNKITSASFRNNNARDVTGVLMYNGGFFFQVIEGKKEDVIYTYNKIILDPRHQNVNLLSDREIEHRSFENWPMALIKLSDVDLDVIDHVVAWNDLINDSRKHEPISEDKIDRLIEALRYKIDMDTISSKAA
ncbi:MULTISPECIES: BLUF domain-containing protein [unclassified Halobacteriovorax]|uniref:BLUF domain-containing protein n=1 Tax=unclassified Halobacteriovorax TaxID=2639665 RepID=UPI000EA2DD96|nr:BLUF domain-containing protein [Halobacteriovorax sp. BALOs_7]AYF44050.1 sensors of blue-light using FAD [Halobacteriovorax sp. BALOs_7]